MEFDADEFKGINDTLGHDAGDEVLRYIASLAESTARRSNRQGDGKDDIARVGGDEYYLVMQGVRTDLADAIVNHLRDKCSAFNVPYKNHEGSRDIPAGASIGAVVVPYVSVITSALDKDTSHVEIPEDFRQKIMDSVDKSLYKEKSRRKPYPPARGQKCYPDDSHLGLMW
jgi:diguanylate cyclase (GGDEF)-like protein